MLVSILFSSWCGPCKLLGPRIEAEVNKFGGKVLLAKLNIDDLGQLAMDQQVSNL